MTTTRLIRPSLIAGRAAVAMLALAAFHVALPAAPLPQWHAAQQSSPSVTQAPRRLPASRKTERFLTD